MEVYINAENLIVGRMASYAAKKALLGNNIKILNCEKAVITGNRKDILGKYTQRRQMGNPSNGPFISRMPDRFVRRAIRGMLPYKKARGKEALQRIMCYIGVPGEFKEKKMITLPSADISKTRSLRFLNVKEICSNMGGKT
jgi:large subunit ribosomal protein L13